MGLLKWILGFFLIAGGLAVLLFGLPFSCALGSAGVSLGFAIGGLVLLAVGSYLLRTTIRGQ